MDAAANQHEHGAELRRSVCPTPREGFRGAGGKLADLELRASSRDGHAFILCSLQVPTISTCFPSKPECKFPSLSFFFLLPPFVSVTKLIPRPSRGGQGHEPVCLWQPPGPVPAMIGRALNFTWLRRSLNTGSREPLLIDRSH